MTLDLLRARELYRSGMSLRQVAESLGCVESTLHRRLLKDGWRARPKNWAHKISIEAEELIERMAMQHATHREIAAATGVSRSTVYVYLKRMDLDRQSLYGGTTAPMRRLFLYGPGDVPREKWCSSCASYHPVAAFHRNKRLRHGIAQWCRPCQSAASKAAPSRRCGRKKQQESVSPR